VQMIVLALGGNWQLCVCTDLTGHAHCNVDAAACP